MEKVRGILERKYKTPFVEGTPDLSGFKRFEFENARYCIRLFRDETVDRRPCMVLSVRDKAIKDSMTLEWSLGKEVDMERF